MKGADIVAGAVVGPESHTPYGYWLAEANSVRPHPSLDQDVEADVCVIGGGYLGLWTAWFVRQADPRARVAVLEAEVCGRGPSGRNGGMVNPVWHQMPSLRARYGDEAALAVGQASADAVVEIRGWCSAHQVDAWYEAHPLVEVSTAPSQDDRWHEATRACDELGVGDRYKPASADEIATHFRSDRVRRGAIIRPSATVQPARLAAGIRDALGKAAVSIYEHSPVVSAEEQGSEVLVRTGRGSVRSDVCVLAVNAGLMGFLPRASLGSLETQLPGFT